MRVVSTLLLFAILMLTGATMRPSVNTATFLRSDVPTQGFRGVVRIRTWQNLYIAPNSPGPFGTFRPDYSRTPYDWQMLPSRHGGYWIRAQVSPGGFASVSWYYWQTDMKDRERKLILHPGADDWETFFLERHPNGGYALKSYGNSNRFVCAEPENHGIHLIANRGEAKQWEQFHVDVIREGLPGDPPPQEPKKIAFICTNCSYNLGSCNGGISGQRCLYCSSPTGRCKCPNCGKEFYEISHTHR